MSKHFDTRALASLPIATALDELRLKLATNVNLVLQAPPGAGKSTGVPLALLDEPWREQRKILMLEPRRLAARAVATRMAQILGERVGATVGYRTRLETKISGETQIEVITEGILTRMLQQDPALEEVALVIFDEFHERNLHADLGLALCLDAQASLRDSLRLLVMSATLDAERVARLLDDAPLITSAGKAFPVTVTYEAMPITRNRWNEPDVVPVLVQRTLAALQSHAGDVLAFLPGQAEIRRAQQQLSERSDLPRNVHVLPLYGDLKFAEQDAALRASAPGQRKIVLATNIAETSLTLEGITIVVDGGLVRRARFNPATGMSRLDTTRISRASAEQRAGRAGRLGPGTCYRLWTESEHAALVAHSAPEIADTDLAPLALDLAEWGVADPATLRWLDPPPPAAFSQARDLLKSLEALGIDERITATGKEMNRLGTHPRLAHMITRAKPLALGKLAVEIAALLGERDVLRFDSRTGDVDFRLRVTALRHGQASEAGATVDRGARDRALQTVAQLERQADVTAASQDEDEDIGRLLALAYPDRVALSRGESGRYLLMSGRGAILTGPQLLARAEFLVVCDLDEGEREARIRLAAPISRESLEALFGSVIQTAERIEWDSRERVVIAQRERWLGALKLDERRLERPDSQRVLAAMLAGIRESGLRVLPWSHESTVLLQRLRFARKHDTSPRAHWPDVEEHSLLATLEAWLAPWLEGKSRLEHLGTLNMSEVLQGLLPWEQRQRLDEVTPTHLAVPSGSRIPIDYSTDSPTLSVRLQEVFGLKDTPRVAGGRVPITLELLSPARRPVQVTRDLESFWQRGYQDVKKELKGRYPKHFWPDDPHSAQATARAKPRGT